MNEPLHLLAMLQEVLQALFAAVGSSLAAGIQKSNRNLILGFKGCDLEPAALRHLWSRPHCARVCSSVSEHHPNSSHGTRNLRKEQLQACPCFQGTLCERQGQYMLEIKLIESVTAICSWESACAER